MTPPARAACVLALVGLFGGAILRSAVHSTHPTSALLESSFAQADLPLNTGGDGVGQQFVVAQVIAPSIGVYQSPGAPNPVLTLPARNPDGAPTVFLVLNQQSEAWLEVLVPVRPNDTTGWVHLAQVILRTDPYGVRVELGRHRLTVWRGNDEITSLAAGVGRAMTNTPKGVYFITELFRPPDPTGLYGPYAFGTSAFSEVLGEFAGGNGTIGIHGTNDPAGIGKDVSHGCIRVDNQAITHLASFLPLGTPVFITP
ncbi:MAG: L,D-transpeptidase [Acidimicrobiales bacterium]